MALSRQKKITIGALSVATFSISVFVAMKWRKGKQIKCDGYSEDEEDKYEPGDSFLSFNESARSMTHPQNVFNSSRLNALDTSILSNESATQNDSIAQMHDIFATKLLPDNVKFISHSKVLELLKNRHSPLSPKYIIFDLRLIDYVGGHIVDSVNINDKSFYDEIPDLLEKYNDTSMVIMQCMDGSLRSIENIEYYSKARNEIVKYYDEKTLSSYYYRYKLKIQHDAHKTVMRSINWNNKQWIKRFVDIKKVEVDFSKNPKMYHNLKEQKLFVIAGGFFDFVNDIINDENVVFDDIIEGFDREYWEELNVMGEKKLYHKKEYYTTRRINPLRKYQTKQEF